MSALVSNVLGTEITVIPTWMRTILKGHYNNTLCNGATWTLVLWKILHVVYSRLMDCYLKQLGIKQYIRTRLTNSLGFCGFFSLTLAYYLVTFDTTKMDLLRGNHVMLNENLPTQVVVAYTLMCTFYLHIALSEGIQCGSLRVFLKYLLLVVACTSAYIVRLLEIPFTLSALMAISGIFGELTKIFYSLLSQENYLNNIFVGILYFCSLTLFIFSHLVVIPLIFLIPMGKMIMPNNDAILIILFSSLLFWLCFALYDSILSNSIFHWLYHAKEEPNDEDDEDDEEEKSKQKIKCPGNLVECSLFPMRTDAAHVLYVMRYEMNKRKIEMEAKKKPKAKSMMLIQTLKCMMALKKKLNQRKSADNSDSDEPSDDNAAVDKSEHVGEDSQEDCESKLETEEVKQDCESKLGTKEVKHETKEDAEESVVVSKDLPSEHNTANDKIIDFDKEASKSACDTEDGDKEEKIVAGNLCDTESLKHDESRELVSEREGKHVTLKSVPDKEIDVELGTKSEAMEHVERGETSVLLEEDRDKEHGELEESKSKVKISGSLKKNSESKMTFDSTF